MALALTLPVASCKKASEGYVTDGELVVVQEYSNIHLGIHDVDTLNPLATKSESVQKIMNIIYEPLFSVDEAGKEEPILAHSYNVSDSGTQMEIKLREGVKWHDGTNFTAEDVAYTLSKMMETEGIYSKVSSRIYSFTAVDNNTIVITFVNPETSPAYLLNFPIIPHHLEYSAETDFIPVGTGGYKFSSRSGTEIVLKPNSRWHGEVVSERDIIVRILKDKKAVADAFNVGELDAVLSDDFDDGITPKTNSITKTMISDKMVFLGFNTQSSVIAPQSVRKAINSVLDRKKIVEQDAYGRGIPAELSIHPNSWSITKEEKPNITSNYAENLMEQDGYAIKDGVYHKGDEKLTMRILVNADNSHRTALAESIATSLKTAGFDVVVERTTYDEYSAKIAADDFDMFIGETEVGKNLNPAAMLSSEDNYFNFNTALIQSAMEQLHEATDEEVIKTQIKDFSILFYSDPPYLPLYFKTDSVIYGSYVSGVEAPVNFDPYKGIERWYFYDKDGKENKEKTDE